MTDGPGHESSQSNVNQGVQNYSNNFAPQNIYLNNGPGREYDQGRYSRCISYHFLA